MNGERSGVSAAVVSGSKVHLNLRWASPLAHADVITGDGRDTKRATFDLSQTGALE